MATRMISMLPCLQELEQGLGCHLACLVANLAKDGTDFVLGHAVLVSNVDEDALHIFSNNAVGSGLADGFDHVLLEARLELLSVAVEKREREDNSQDKLLNRLGKVLIPRIDHARLYLLYLAVLFENVLQLLHSCSGL
jgi:hypothetical protein